MQAIRDVWEAALAGDRAKMQDKIRKHAITVGAEHPAHRAGGETEEYVSPRSLVMDVALNGGEDARSTQDDRELATTLEDLLQSGWPLLPDHAVSAMIKLINQQHSEFRMVVLIMWQLGGLERNRTASITGAAEMVIDYAVSNHDEDAPDAHEKYGLQKLLDCQTVATKVYQKVFGGQMAIPHVQQLLAMVAMVNTGKHPVPSLCHTEEERRTAAEPVCPHSLVQDVALGGGGDATTTPDEQELAETVEGLAAGASKVEANAGSGSD